jgi:hypothetical protein
MAPFRRVEARRAGPQALGILIPPGRRTLVILRPRALAWDLLPLRLDDVSGTATIRDFERDEAVAVARAVHHALEAGAAHANPVQADADPSGAGCRVWTEAGPFPWIACLRVSGQPYRPVLFASLDEARAAAARLAGVLWPAADGEQELYFNTQSFVQ